MDGVAGMDVADSQATSANVATNATCSFEVMADVPTVYRFLLYHDGRNAASIASLLMPDMGLIMHCSKHLRRAYCARTASNVPCKEGEIGGRTRS